MSNFTFDYDVFSDLYKDATGIRPRGHEFYAPETSDERRQEIWDYYVGAVEREIEREKAMQADAAARFESAVAETIAAGAADRETAIRWLMDAEGVDGDVGYFEYRYGLEYGYINGVKPWMEAA